MPSLICTVGPVEKNLIGPPGYSFQLLDNRSITVRPIVTFMYEHRFDAANAQFIMEQALMHVLDIRVDAGNSRRSRRVAT
jgi:hypothetical protein